MEELADKVIYLYKDIDEYDEDSMAKHVNESTAGLLEKILPQLKQIDLWEKDQISQVIKGFVKQEEIKFPHIAQPLRIAISGSDNTPSIDLVLQLIGKNRSIDRIEAAIKAFS